MDKERGVIHTLLVYYGSIRSKIATISDQLSGFLVAHGWLLFVILSKSISPPMHVYPKFGGNNAVKRLALTACIYWSESVVLVWGHYAAPKPWFCTDRYGTLTKPINVDDRDPNSGVSSVPLLSEHSAGLGLSLAFQLRLFWCSLVSRGCHIKSPPQSYYTPLFTNGEFVSRYWTAQAAECLWWSLLLSPQVQRTPAIICRVFSNEISQKITVIIGKVGYVPVAPSNRLLLRPIYFLV